MGLMLRDQFPLRLVIGTEDCTFLLDQGFTFSNVDPGGFEAASFSIPKDMPNSIRGTYVRLDCGLQVAWEGRIGQPQRSLGHRTQLNCEGYGARFKETAGSMVFVDRDLTKWQAPSYSRQISLVSSNVQLATSQVAADPTSNTPALVHTISGTWASPYLPTVEAWYDAGPLNLISLIYYNLIDPTGSQGTGFTDKLFLSSDAIASVVEASANLMSTTGAAGYFAPGTPYRYAIAQHTYSNTPSGSANATYNAYWRNMAVYGNHALQGQGADPGGFFPSQIFGWAVSQIPTLQPGNIQTTDASNYIIAHSVYYTPVTFDQIANDMALAQGWHWGVWESPAPLTGDPRPRVDFLPRPQPGTFTGSCLRQDCDTLDIREDLAGQYNEMIVTYSDVAGVPGAVTVTTDNPILDQAGILNRTAILNGGTMTAATAAVFGQIALLLTNIQARVAGTATITGPINGPAGPMAAWMLHAGQDRIRISDLPCTDAFGATNDLPITRVECSASSSGLSTNLEVGSGANLVETLQARLSSATTLAAQGGV